MKDKKILIIAKTKNSKNKIYEIVFKKENFFHLTGLKTNKNISSSLFYQMCLNHKLKIKDFEFKNNVSKWKLEAIPQIMKIDVLANQIGDFMRIGNLLKTDILIGTTRNVCLGLKFLENKKIYVPNTVLKEDIRKITSNRYRIIVILKKNIKEKNIKILLIYIKTLIY